MGLSKKNLDKLNTFIKNQNLSPNHNSNKIKNTDNNHKNLNNPHKSELSSEIFYSLIDNSKTLEETVQINHSLRESEKFSISMNSKKTDFSNNLSTEDKLYDEFNYLLEE